MGPSRSLRGALALVGAVTLASSGCGSSADAEAASAPQSTQIRLVFLLPDSGSPYAMAALRGAEMKATEMGVDLDVRDAAGDPDGQIRQLRDAVLSADYVGGVVLPLDPAGMCDVATDLAPERNFMVVPIAVPLCGRSSKQGQETWAPGTLAFVSGGWGTLALRNPAASLRTAPPGTGARAMGASAVQALYDARVGRTPIPRFYSHGPVDTSWRSG